MKSLATRIPQVAVALPLSAKIARDMRRGVLRYAKECGPWIIHLLEGREFSQTVFHLSAVRGLSGFIGYVTTDEEADLVARLKVPYVLRWLDSGRLPPKVERLMQTSATVSTDSAAIGRKAAEYFLASRYPNFAYVGEPEDLGWSLYREEAFVGALAAAGKDCRVFHGPSTRSFSSELPVLGRWLKPLPVPTGIFAVHDERARQVADACAVMGLSVPSEIGILGCDNDDELCESFYPAISSIAVDAERAAYLAAKMLDGCMRGVFAPHRIVDMPHSSG